MPFLFYSTPSFSFFVLFLPLFFPFIFFRFSFFRPGLNLDEDAYAIMIREFSGHDSNVGFSEFCIKLKSHVERHITDIWGQVFFFSSFFLLSRPLFLTFSQSFDLIDSNNLGHMTPGNLRSFLSTCGEEVKEDQAEEMVYFAQTGEIKRRRSFI